jgi:hypothetical protein
MAPKDENELQHMLKTAVACGCPVSLRYPRGAGIGVPLDERLQAIPVGKGEILLDPPGAELAVMLVKAKGFQIMTPEADLFRDVSVKNWAAPYINVAVQRKYVSGYPDETFMPYRKITRAEAVTVMAKFAEYGLKFAHEPHPNELIYDVDTALKSVQLMGGRKEWGFNFDMMKAARVKWVEGIPPRRQLHGGWA